MADSLLRDEGSHGCRFDSWSRVFFYSLDVFSRLSEKYRTIPHSDDSPELPYEVFSMKSSILS